MKNSLREEEGRPRNEFIAGKMRSRISGGFKTVWRKSMQELLKEGTPIGSNVATFKRAPIA